MRVMCLIGLVKQWPIFGHLTPHFASHSAKYLNQFGEISISIIIYGLCRPLINSNFVRKVTLNSI